MVKALLTVSIFALAALAGISHTILGNECGGTFMGRGKVNMHMGSGACSAHR